MSSILCHIDKLIITQELETLYVLNFNIFQTDVYLYISRASDIRRSHSDISNYFIDKQYSILVLYFPVCI